MHALSLRFQPQQIFFFNDIEQCVAFQRLLYMRENRLAQIVQVKNKLCQILNIRLGNQRRIGFQLQRCQNRRD